MHESKLTRQVSGVLNFGRLEVTYSNNALESLTQLLISAKQLPSFRDLNLIPNFMLPKRDVPTGMTPDEASYEREK